MAQSPSISDVAKAAGVSMKTVSRVINNEAGVTEKTKDRVLRAIKSLAYTPSVSARILAGKKTYSFTMLCVAARGDYFSNLHFAALAECQTKGYRLDTSLIEDYYDLDKEQLARQMETMVRKPFPDGFILTPPFSDDPTVLQFLTMNKIAFVRISPKQNSNQLGPCVLFDEQRAADEIVQYLIDRGHKRIAIVKGLPSHGSASARLNGYLEALKRNQVSPDPSLIFEGDFQFASGVVAGQQLLSLDPSPTAVFASNDEMAAGVNMAIHKAGLDVPNDISIIGFDDDLIAESTWPQLTTIKQPLKEMATTAVQWLIDEKSIPTNQTATLDYKFIIRDSVAQLSH